jgi:hypothetical protein
MAKSSTSFTNGNAGRPHGAKSNKTKIKQSIGIDNWQALSNYVQNDGIDKLLNELQQLEGKEYVTAHMAILEYFKPKMQRVETNTEVNLFTGCDSIFIP